MIKILIIEPEDVQLERFGNNVSIGDDDLRIIIQHGAAELLVEQLGEYLSEEMYPTVTDVQAELERIRAEMGDE